MKESVLLKDFLVKFSRLGHRLFRQNVGKGWIGTTITKPGIYKLTRGDVLIKQARPLIAGLVKGSGDLVGWTNVTVTNEMVGKSVPVFTNAEVKTPNVRVTIEQKNFIDYINSVNGIAMVAYSFDDITEGIEEWKSRNCM